MKNLAYAYRAFVFALAVLGISAPAMAQQESPLTEKMVEKERAKRKKVSEKEAALGAEFRDNPEWREEELAAEREEEERRAGEALLAEQGGRREQPGYVPGYRRQLGVGLSPLAPAQLSVLPGGVTPAPGAETEGDSFRADFHGYLQAGLRAGLGTRESALEGQKTTPIHGDPVVPGGAFGWFEHTYTVPVPWTQLNFSFGNKEVSATAVLAAWSLSQSDEAAGYFQPPSKLWFNDAYLTYRPQIGAAELGINAGVFQERYGQMGEYDAGAYGTSLIAVIYGVGATSTLRLPFQNDVTITTEAGFKGDFNKPSIDLVPDQSNEFASAVEGSTYVGHGHVAVDFNRWVELTAHGIYSFSQDDRGDALAGRDIYLGDRPKRDGSLTLMALDGRFRLRRFGHLYFGASHVIGKDTLTLANTVQLLNNGPGRDLSRRYWSFDSGGNGKLTILGGQYRLSLGRLLRYPATFENDAPDLVWTTFGMFVKQENDGDVFANTDMFKVGTELYYSILPWFALSGRFDAVLPNLANAEQNFFVLSPKVVFRSGWDSRATLTLQYSGYLIGDDVLVRGDERLLNNPTGDPDRHMLALYGTIWW